MDPDHGRSERPARALGLAAWLGLLAGVANLAGPALGEGVLAPPPLTQPGAWGAWAGGRTPTEAIFAVLIVVVVALAWYLLAATVLVFAARLVGSRRLITFAEILALPVVRRGVHGVLGMGLVGTSVAGAAAGAGPPPGEPVDLAVARLVVSTGHTSVPDDSSREGDPGATPVMSLLPAAEPPGPPPPSEVATDGDDRSRVEPAPTLAHEREVRAGDHLWGWAEQILDDAGEETDVDRVAAYWRVLVEANRGRLADPANPDLVFPGQVLTVPTPQSPLAPQTVP